MAGTCDGRVGEDGEGAHVLRGVPSGPREQSPLWGDIVGLGRAPGHRAPILPRVHFATLTFPGQKNTAL